jgi:predicted nucleic acid-binding protein
MIFVDSSAWFAVYSRRDANHDAVARAIRSIREQLVTSDFVIDETLTLLQARGEQRRAVAFGNRVIDRGEAMIIRISDKDFSDAWETFRKFGDKQ